MALSTSISVFVEIQALYAHIYVFKGFYEKEAACLLIQAFSFNHHLLLYWGIVKLPGHTRKLGTRYHFCLCS